MITLITGGPGMGKTALVVWMLKNQYSGRPVFTNIRGLTLPHAKLPRLETWTHEHEQSTGGVEHHFTFPPGAVLVVDECQSIYPPRANGAKVPPHVAALATHRHEGLDILLITQGSGLLDSFVHKQVKGGLHIFLHKPLLFKFRYERNERINEESKTELALCAKSKYKIPKEVFPLYKSSELHTKPPKARLPTAAYFLIAAAIGVPIVGFNFYSAMAGRMSDHAPGANALQPGPAAAPQGTPTGTGLQVSEIPTSMIDALTPTDPQNPLSAPLYASVAPTPIPPEIKGCIASKRACTCYTQQQTPIWIPEPQCRDRAAGLYYDPYQPPVPESKQRPMQAISQYPPSSREGDGVSETVNGQDEPRSPAGDSPPSGEGVS